MKIGDKVITLEGHEGVISQIDKLGNNTVITFEDRSRWIKERDFKPEKKKKIKE